ncbi:MAG: hypothetical protein JST86_19035 [Bacteroidetes bacterium]|nr:hypothetical protein [Bacteroidota bacterium]
MNIKQVLFFSVLFFSVAAVAQKKTVTTKPPAKYPLKVELQNLDEGQPDEAGKPVKHISITITNTADTTFTFWLMSCSWHSCLRFEPSIAAIYNTSTCDDNKPRQIKLAPKETYVMKHEYIFSSASVKSPALVSVGLRVIKHASTMSIDEALAKHISPFAVFFDSEKFTHKDFLWSKPVKFNY